MDEEPPEVKSDPTPEDLEKHRLPDPITEGERETFEAKIKELKEENEILRERLAEAEKPKPVEKRAGFLERFQPL